MKFKNKLFFVILIITTFLLSGCFKQNKEKIQSYSIISTQDLEKNISNPDWIILDTRENNAYNGWNVDGVEKGGHIPQSIDFSAAWLDAKDEQILNLFPLSLLYSFQLYLEHNYLL